MGRLFIPAEQKIPGPWLLDRKQLLELDKVIQLAQEKLLIALNEEVKQNSGKENIKIIHDINTTVTLTAINRNKIVDKSIAGILKDQKANEFKPTELKIEIGQRYSDCFLVFEVSNCIDGDLEYSIKCNDDKIKDEINYEMESWLENIKPYKLVQIWSNWKLLVILPIIFFGYLFLSMSMTVETIDNKDNLILKKQIDSLLVQGINKNNQYKAIEMLLKTKGTQVEGEHKLKLNKTYFKAFIIILIALILISISPKTTIGIGKRVSELKFYRFWIKFVIYSIPSLFIFPKIFEIISSLIYK
jgi:hypothetical protein